MKKCKVLFSFDDARLDTYAAVLLAKQYGIKSTINVTTAYVDNSIAATDRPSVLPAMSKEQVLSLKNDDFVELACHSANHKNTFEDILLGRKQLKEWLGLEDNDSLGFASPNSKVDFNKDSLEKFKNEGFEYVRIGHVKDSREFIYRIIRKIARILHLKYLLYATYKKTLTNTVNNDYLIHGIPVLHDNTVKQFKYILNKAIKNGNTCLFIFHSVLNDSDPMANDTWSWEMTKYIKLCEYLQHLKETGAVEFLLTRDLVK